MSRVRRTVPTIRTWAALAWLAIASHADAHPAAVAAAVDPFANGPRSPAVLEGVAARVPPATAGPFRIHLAAGYTLDPALGEPALPPGLRAAAPAIGRRAFLVHFGAGDPEAARRAIEAAGGRVISFVPDRTWLVRMDAGAELTLGGPGAWIGAWQPAYKLSPRLPVAADARVTASVLLFPDANVARVTGVARAAGAAVLAAADHANDKVLRLDLPRPALDALARDDDVQWIEPYVAPHTNNQYVQAIVQTGAVGNRRLWDLGLKGQGQVVMTSDTGLETHHIAIKDPLVPINNFGAFPNHRKVIEYDRASDDAMIAFGDHGAFHGSHTAGTFVGNDDGFGASPNDGVAKSAKLWFVDLSGPLLGQGIVTPVDLNDLFQPSYAGNAGGAARVSSNSWGSDVAGVYTIEAMQVDEFTWNHPDYLIFFANGNSGPGPATVASPAVAKNVVGVGASGNSDALNTITPFSARGPAADGRIKPDILAPGAPVTSSTTADSGYTTLSGTSMASPAAAGCATLMREYLTEGWYPTGAKVAANAITPSAALLRAMVINSGNNTIPGPNAPDNTVGWGRIDADSVLYFAGDTRRLLLVDAASGLGEGHAIDYTINVTDGSTPLEISLAWTDYPGNPLASVQLVNDLDLTVTKGGTTWLGNVYANGVSVTGGARDARNTEESVRIASPATGLYTVRVAGMAVPAGPQRFGLAITGGVGTTAGAIALDRASYGATATVRLRVTDTNASSPLPVTIASTSEPGGETVTLTGANGVFSGSIALSPLPGAAHDGVLRVSNGDVLTATYVDASPSATVTAKARVEFQPPEISAVAAHGAGAGGVTVTWTTDANADSRIYYGPTSDLGQSTPLDTLAVLDHAVGVTGLASGQTYYFDVESRDLNGNITRDDNGGQHYRFTPGSVADVLLVYDGASFEKSARYLASLAALGWRFDLWAGAQAATPRLGNAAVGLRAYRAVWWQNGIEHYPPFTDAARDSLAAYMNGGGRLAVTGHDVAWANGSTGSAYYTTVRGAWLENTLHTDWLVDPSQWSGLTGVALDPVSGPYAGGIPYTPTRSGAAGDEVAINAGAGSALYDWISGSQAPNNCGFRWESTAPQGSLGNGVYGGTKSRLLTNYFEWACIDDANASSATRDSILERSLTWLIGNERPTVTVTSPVGGQVLTGSTVNVTWTESSEDGISARRIDYSLDGGSSWTIAALSAGPSPYVWTLGSIANSARVLVRVRVTDAHVGVPTLSSEDTNDAVFAIRRAGGDAAGPVVVAGSVHVTPNPIDNTQPASVTATVTDAGSGGSEVVGAEWSYGDIAAPPGKGHAMSGAFGSQTVDVSDALATGTFTTGTHRVWVRGRDSAWNWGAAGSLQVVVNGNSELLGATDLPRDFALAAAVPNPATGATRIRWSLPERARVDLAVFDVTGRRVRVLVAGERGAGVHQSDWDLRDGSGALVRSGVYYYRLDVAGRTFKRRLVALN